MIKILLSLLLLVLWHNNFELSRENSHSGYKKLFELSGVRVGKCCKFRGNAQYVRVIACSSYRYSTVFLRLKVAKIDARSIILD